MKKEVLRKLSYGMYVISSKDENDKDVGCVVNTVVQITSKDPTIIVSINHDNYTNEVISKTNKFLISVLPTDIDKEIIGKFGYFSSRDTDKFSSVEYEELDGIKYIKDSIGVMSCRVVNVMETATHTVFLASVNDEIMLNDKETMTYKYYHDVLKGKSPKNAPTYVEEEKSTKKVYKCQVCGYEVETDNLPDDYVCPICGVKKDKFVVK